MLPAEGRDARDLRDDDANRLRLRRGDVLVLEERWRRAPAPGRRRPRAPPRGAADARRSEAPLAGGCAAYRAATRSGDRSAVRRDRWADDDALPFPLCLSKRIGGVLVGDMAGARAATSCSPTTACTAPRADDLRAAAGRPGAALSARPHRGRAAHAAGPRAQSPAATRRVLVDRRAPRRAPRCSATWPTCARRSTCAAKATGGAGARGATCWPAMRDARRVRRRDRERRPRGAALRRRRQRPRARRRRRPSRARYRVGNGAAGNVGAEAIGACAAPFAGITRVRNPLPAHGRARPASRSRRRGSTRRRRSGARSARSPPTTTPRSTERAAARAARRRDAPLDRQLAHGVHHRRPAGGACGRRRRSRPSCAAFLERYRMAGHDLEIDAPRFVAARHRAARLREAGLLPRRRRAALLDAFSAARAGRRRHRLLPSRTASLRPAGVPERR